MYENEHPSRAGPAPSREDSGGRNLHAGAVVVRGFGVLILGGSGAGKSGLALRLIALGASLVADDRVVLTRSGSRLTAEAPVPLRGLIEARGIGLLRIPFVERATIALAVDLDHAPEARMPEARKIALLGCNIDFIRGRDVPDLDAIITVLAQSRAVVI